MGFRLVKDFYNVVSTCMHLTDGDYLRNVVSGLDFSLYLLSNITTASLSAFKSPGKKQGSNPSGR